MSRAAVLTGGCVENLAWVVMKFGGTSVASAERWATIASQAQSCMANGERPVVVCSALSGVSDAIEAIIEACIKGHPESALRALEEKHAALSASLGVEPREEIGVELREISDQVRGASLIGEVSPRLHARLMAMGEQMSTKLGAAYLRSMGMAVTWVDARDHLVAEPEAHAPIARQMLSAQCAFEPDPELQAAFAQLDGVLVTQGFIARNAGGETVLLGRGGSDTSAAYFAAKLQAKRCEIWTDVPGMFTADPRQVPTARVLRSLDFNEAQEIATMGAKVLHPRAIPPCRAGKIPVVIRCTPHPQMEGTTIQQGGAGDGAGVKAISTRKGVMLVSMETMGMWQTVGFMADAFAVFKGLGLSIDLVSTSETNVTVSLDPSANSTDTDTLHALATGLGPLCEAQIIGPCASISLVGRQIRSLLHRLGPVLGLFEEQRIHLLSQAASDLNLTFVVDEDQADRLVSKMHARLFDTQTEDSVYGPSWEMLFDHQDRDSSRQPIWWTSRRDDLLALAAEHSPCFALNPHAIDTAAASLNQMTALDRRFYAIKANAHPDVLARLYREGFGFETVSPGELDHIRSLFPDLPTERLLYTPNFAPKEDYEHGFASGAMVTIDNLHPLTHWPEVFRDREVLLRLDPGKGRGHHAHVRTAGRQSKFGIAPQELDAVLDAVRKANTTVFALHAHAGSGILTPEGWAETARFLAQVAERFPTVRALDLGGGLGIAEKPNQRPLDLQAVNASLEAFKREHPRFELWMEPGRYLVAHAGVLLARVTQIKQKGDVTYVGVETGMNSLIRPALYGAYHPIMNLTKLDGARTQLAHIVGPICETGDVLGHARHIADAAEGDVLLVGNTGAYGRTMSSDYNRRSPAIELILPD
jgi:diaminopimelate decarboxylase/aspartate kinase